jgi:hypothetical protein
MTVDLVLVVPKPINPPILLSSTNWNNLSGIGTTGLSIEIPIFVLKFERILGSGFLLNLCVLTKVSSVLS